MITLRGQILVSSADGDFFFLLEEGGGGGVCTFKTLFVCRFKTSPCVPAPRPHVVTHVCVLLVHTGTFESAHGGFSACHGTHHDHTTATTTHNHSPTRQRQGHTTNQTTTSTNQPAAQFDSTRENSPGLDTARIDRLIALSSVSVWWCRFFVKLM